MNKFFSKITTCLIILTAIIGFLFSGNEVYAKGTCPEGNGWTKIEDSTPYPVSGAVEFCYKAGRNLTDTIPEGGFGQEGRCSSDNIQNCELSHWAFRVPLCPLPGDGDWAHYEEGWHQIVGGDLLWGADDVYSLGEDYLQCYCGEDGTGIQTYWWRTQLQSLLGWFSENGLQWNLGDYHYLAQNTYYDCSE